MTEFFTPVAVLCAVTAVTLAGLGKGGFSGLGMLSTPLLAFAVGPVTAAAIMLPVLMLQDVASIWNYRAEFDRRNLVILIPPGLVGILIGYGLAAHLSEAAVGIALGAISVAFAGRSLLLLLARRATAAPSRPSMPFGWLCGAGAGFTSMVAHAGGPPFQIFVLPQRLPRNIYVGTSVIFFGVMNWVKAIAYIALGQVTTGSLGAALLLAPVAVAATYAGIWLVRRVDQERFYLVTYSLLMLVGLKLLWDGLSVIVAS
ncbi:MAG: sulfite exporter TauE/SafE family protein [Rhizobiaceae bacterium]|nr:sulfite exporter TauE/SafE family protein [Rhizobiaceae bacterium]